MIKIGTHVQYIKSIEWGPVAGDTGTVTHIFNDGTFLVRVAEACDTYCTHRREVALVK